MESIDNKERTKVQEIFSKVIRAGKRTYFFDVKSTRNNEYYLTITESKKKFSEDGNFRYEKHKLFLYPEDFGKFTDTFNEVIAYINENQPEQGLDDEEALPGEQIADNNSGTEISGNAFSEIEFDDI